jgi:FKBP-type peptidyl-prolyl cis-trans isomerase (trigger factor)
MEREARQKIKADLKDQVLKGLLDANPIEVPRALVHQEMHNMQHEAMRQLGIKDHDKAPAIENDQAEGARRGNVFGLRERRGNGRELSREPAIPAAR